RAGRHAFFLWRRLGLLRPDRAGNALGMWWHRPIIRRPGDAPPTRTGSAVSASKVEMMTFLQDLKFGARLLAKTPGFTAVAALSLALGIGANTTIFTLVNAVLLHPLPVEDPSELVSVYVVDERNQDAAGGAFLQLAPANFMDLRGKNDVFSDMTGHQA